MNCNHMHAITFPLKIPVIEISVIVSYFSVCHYSARMSKLNVDVCTWLYAEHIKHHNVFSDLEHHSSDNT